MLPSVAAVLLGTHRLDAGTVYFDAAAGAGNGVGGNGTLAAQTTALYSKSATGDATLVAAAATDDGIFQGTAGTVTFSAAYALNSATFNTSGYILTASSTTARVFSAPITLATNVTLSLIEATQTADRTLGISSVAGGGGSILNIQGAQTGTASARINLAAANATVSVPVTITGTGTSLGGFVATATGTSVTNTITNNSSFTTLLGATSGFDLTLGANAVLGGTAGVQFSAGGSGGAGLVTINSANTYAGATTLNNSTTGVVRLGVDNALSTATALQFGIGNNNTGALDLNGHSQTVASLAVTGTGTVNGIANTAATAAALVVNGSAATTYSSVIGTPANVTNLTGANNNIALTLANTNTGSLTLSGTNTYTGNTTIGGGTLALAAASNNIAGSAQITVGTAAGSTALLDVSGVTGGFTLATGQTLAGFGTINGKSGTPTAVTVATGSTLTAGSGKTAASAIGTLTLTNDSLVLQSGGTDAIKGSSAVSHDLVKTAALNLQSLSSSSRFALNLVSVGSTPTGTFTILQTSGLTVPNGHSATALTDLFTLSVDGTLANAGSYNVTAATDASNAALTDVNLTYSPTPEPATAALALLGASAVVGRRGRRNRVSYPSCGR